jgi:hypothetical protein
VQFPLRHYLAVSSLGETTGPPQVSPKLASHQARCKPHRPTVLAVPPNDAALNICKKNNLLQFLQAIYYK